MLTHSVFEAARPWQWSKNLLVFLPLLAAHQWKSTEAWIGALICYMAFCASASGLYLINDIKDVEIDRQHPTRRQRPFARGKLSRSTAMTTSALCLMAGLLLAQIANVTTFVWLAGYVASGLIYTFLVKGTAWMDIVFLTGFYLFRLMSGGSASHISPSAWLICFIAFLCLSLACLKRTVEFRHQDSLMHARGYQARSRWVLFFLGVGAAFVAILLLVMYLRFSPAVHYYQHPNLLWGSIVCVAVWIALMWVRTHRGMMKDDPVAASLADPWTWLLVLGAALFIFMSAGNF